MAIGHMDVRAHSRSQGHCVAAALAYRFGLNLTDSRTGVRHEYARRAHRAEIGITGFCYGPHAPTWNPHDPQTWADALEAAERRKNSLVCRDIVYALPHELTKKQRNDLARKIAQALATKYGTTAAYAVHRPGKKGDSRNWHVHVLLATRAIDKDGSLGPKLRQFHIRAKRAEKDQEDKRTDTGGSDEIRTLRAEWETMCNQALHEAGSDAQIAMGRLENDADRRPVLSPAEVSRERRRRGRASRGKSVAETVAESATDGGCATRRGTELAQQLREGRADELLEQAGAKPRRRRRRRIRKASGALPDAAEQRRETERALEPARSVHQAEPGQPPRPTSLAAPERPLGTTSAVREAEPPQLPRPALTPITWIRKQIAKLDAWLKPHRKEARSALEEELRTHAKAAGLALLDATGTAGEQFTHALLGERGRARATACLRHAIESLRKRDGPKAADAWRAGWRPERIRRTIVGLADAVFDAHWQEWPAVKRQHEERARRGWQAHAAAAREAPSSTSQHPARTRHDPRNERSGPER